LEEKSMRKFVTIFAVLAICGVAQASLNFSVGTKFNGDGTTYGSGPWVNISIVDVAAGQVDLTITAVGLSGGEKIGELFLNLDPLLSPANLVFSGLTKTGSFTDPTITTGINNQKADGDGYYDIQLLFDPDGPDRAFNGGEAVKYTVTCPSLMASSFNFLSAPPDGGGTGPFYTVVDIRSPSDVSGTTVWATIPEPATMLLLGFGALALRRK
jgi:hypothetical protein